MRRKSTGIAVARKTESASVFLSTAKLDFIICCREILYHGEDTKLIARE